MMELKETRTLYKNLKKGQKVRLGFLWDDTVEILTIGSNAIFFTNGTHLEVKDWEWNVSRLTVVTEKKVTW